MKNSRQLCFSMQALVAQKILNVKSIFNTVKNSRATLFFRANASCSKNPECKKYIQYSEKFQGNSVFQGKRELLKNPEW